MALLSEEKTSHLSHVMLGALKRHPAVRFKDDDVQVLRDIKRVLAAELAEEGVVDQTVRARLASYSKPMIEGSSEWDVMYRKCWEEEVRRRKKP